MGKLLPVTENGKEIYHIRITDAFDGLCGELAALGYGADRKVCVVTDSAVNALYGEEVEKELRRGFPNVFLHAFPAGEASKNTATVNGVYEFLISKHFDRHDLIVALGGGVTGDLAGFAAATYLRGIDFVQVPTTLISQSDSSIGGKTGVDYLRYKNMVGAFYQPKLVYMNLNTLKSLPKEQLISGFGEVLKHGLIKKAKFFGWMEAHYDDILAYDYAALEEMVYQNCLIKRDIVERDPKERGERALLNFGHTIGHAVEKLADFALPHGVCVGIGIAAASHISMRRGKLSEGECARIERTLSRFGLPTKLSSSGAFSVPRKITADEILQTTKLDKKMVGNRIKFILLERIGNAYIETELTEGQILEGISHILS